MTPLEDKLIRHIQRLGPITIAEFMTIALLDPEHGVYSTKQPIGREGDFVTAPEISQMFGEMLGLWVAQTWLDQGQPTPFALAELGPGRGTLMADMLRATKGVRGFHEALSVYLLEASEPLKEIQADVLNDFAPTWIKSLDELPNHPTYLIANEFFDCLPIRQFRKTDAGWQEQMVAASDATLGFMMGTAQPLDVQSAAEFVEVSSASVSILSQIDQHIAQNGGAALILDYGDWGSDGDTLQALHKHQKVDPLSHLGRADLTAHVDFQALGDAVTQCARPTFTTQGAFLETLGITVRAQALAQKLNGPALETHIAALTRLTHPEQMGTLFKVLGLKPADAPPLIGFPE